MLLESFVIVYSIVDTSFLMFFLPGLEVIFRIVCKIHSTIFSISFMAWNEQPVRVDFCFGSKNSLQGPTLLSRQINHPLTDWPTNFITVRFCFSFVNKCDSFLATLVIGFSLKNRVTQTLRDFCPQKFSCLQFHVQYVLSIMVIIVGNGIGYLISISW